MNIKVTVKTLVVGVLGMVPKCSGEKLWNLKMLDHKGQENKVELERETNFRSDTIKT